TNDFIREGAKDLLSAAKEMEIDLTLTGRGLVKSPRSNLNSVPQRFRRILERFNSQIIGSLETFSLALPEKEVAPNEFWNYDIPFELGYSVVLNEKRHNIHENLVYKLHYRYVGA